MLYIVATPIGNLEDITLRAVSILKEADFVLSEDTRVTKKLLNHFGIETPTISFHEYSDPSKYQKILDLLGDDKNLALVTDAGTPGISDPGSFLVQTVREKLPEVKIVPIPGASALTALLSVSGLNTKEFTFLGFPPHKKGRATFFKNLAELIKERPVVIYESKHRVVKALESLCEVATESKIVLGRELTKIYEELLIDSPSNILQYLSDNPEKLKGEFVILIS